MRQIQVKGFVPDNFSGNEFSLRIEDSRIIEKFYGDEKINTGLRYAEGFPIVSVRGELASKCKPGDRVLLTIETNHRAGKVGIKNIDIVKFAESFGAKGLKINHSSEIIKILKKAMKEKGPVIIEVPIDYTDNKKLFQSAVSSILS